jgi:DNA-binding Lrp family transcriptional regulator
MIGINQNKWGNDLEADIIREIDDELRTQSDIDPKEVNGFFSKKGAVEMLLFLGDGPKPFETLNKVMTVSRSTVSNRLTEASKIGIISEETVYLPDKKVRPYRLNLTGLLCMDIANKCGISQAFEQWYESRERYRNKIVEFNNEVEELFEIEDEEEPIPELEDLLSDHIKDTAGKTVYLDI